MTRILIIDDEVGNLESLKLALRDENPGWVIETAQNEEEGEKIIRECIKEKNPVEVILTDLIIENDTMGGMNILQKLKKIDPMVMTILFTAYEEKLDRYAAFELGAFDVVEKNIRGTAAHKELSIKTRAALHFRNYIQKVGFLSRYFDPKLFDVIDRDPSILSVSRRIVTIVFWDIRGFSGLCVSSKAHPTLVSGFLKDFSEAGAQTIFKHNGLLDKLIGDGIMALFGVINHKEDKGVSDAIAAVKAAKAMNKTFAGIEKKWKKQWSLYIPEQIEIGLGCGIHTGEVLVGNVGTDFRDQFTALGPDVNFAARIVARAKPGQILISQTTKSRVGKISVSPEGEISDVKNMPGTYKLFSVD